MDLVPTDRSLLLTAVQGNTTTGLRILDEGGVVARRQVPSGQGEAAAVAALLEEAGARPGRAAVLSVRPDRLAPLEGALGAAGVGVRLAGRDLPCPLALDYREGEVGTDRWVGALAAFRRHGGALVVDCGTAVTFNLVSPQGRFLGGAIACGYTAMVMGLGAAAPVLHLREDGPPTGLPAAGTQDCLRLGHRLGFCGMLDRLAEELLAAVPFRAVEVATGGAAEIYLQGTRRRPVHEPELLHHGLWLLDRGKVAP